MKKIIWLVFLSLMGCLSPLKKTQTQYYYLKSSACVASPARKASIALELDPQTDSLYTGRRIVYQIQPYQIATYEQSLWALPVERMIQEMLSQALTCHTQVKSQDENWQLSLALHHLFFDFSDPKGHFEVECFLTLKHQGVSFKTQSFQRRVPLVKKELYQGIVVANQTLDRLMRQMAQWTNEQISAHPR